MTVSNVLHAPVAVFCDRTHMGSEGLYILVGKTGADPLLPFSVDSLQEGSCPLAFFCEKEADCPAVIRIDDSAYISGIFEFSDGPGNSTLVKVVVPDKGFLHDVLLFIKQHQNREMAGRKIQGPEPVVEKDDCPGWLWISGPQTGSLRRQVLSYEPVKVVSPENKCCQCNNPATFLPAGGAPDFHHPADLVTLRTLNYLYPT